MTERATTIAASVARAVELVDELNLTITKLASMRVAVRVSHLSPESRIAPTVGEPEHVRAEFAYLPERPERR